MQHFGQSIEIRGTNIARQKEKSTKLEVNKPDAHVHSAVVLTNVEIEVLVLHPEI